MSESGLIARNSHRTFHCGISAGGFLAAILPYGESFAIELSSNDCKNPTGKSVEAFVHKLLSTAKSNSYELKLITNVASENLQSSLSKRGLHFAKIVPVTGSFEVIFFPDKGVLKMAQAAKPHPEPSPTARAPERTRVLMIDDSATIRMFLRKMFAEDSSIDVVGECENPLHAAQMIEALKPNVVTLDIHMPEMDGVTLLKQLLPKYKLPFVMVTSVSMEDGDHVIRALEEGAVDYIQKPSSSDLLSLGPTIIEKVKAAVNAQVNKVVSRPSVASHAPISHGELDLNRLVAIGSSTGGVEALKVVLTALPKQIPPIVITQHIPAMFSRTFAERMNSLCPFEVKEAADGDEIYPGRVLIAPGGTQFKVKKRNGKLWAEITDEAPVNRHKPSVDVLFDSVVSNVGSSAIGIILTGMGDDGARGLLRLKELGCQTIAQDEKSCVVFGMPREAIKRGAALQVLSLDVIPSHLLRLLMKRGAA